MHFTSFFLSIFVVGIALPLGCDARSSSDSGAGGEGGTSPACEPPRVDPLTGVLSVGGRCDADDDLSNVAGDCRTVRCTCGSRVTYIDFDPPPKKPCFSNICTDELPQYRPLGAGAPCGDGLVCDGEGTCVAAP